MLMLYRASDPVSCFCQFYNLNSPVFPASPALPPWSGGPSRSSLIEARDCSLRYQKARFSALSSASVHRTLYPESAISRASGYLSPAHLGFSNAVNDCWFLCRRGVNLFGRDHSDYGLFDASRFVLFYFQVGRRRVLSRQSCLLAALCACSKQADELFLPWVVTAALCF